MSEAETTDRQGDFPPAGAVEPKSAGEVAVARSFIHRFLAKAYEDPSPQNWTWLGAVDTQRALEGACVAVGITAPGHGTFTAAAHEAFNSAYVAAFGHSARGSCPMNEVEYGDLNADALFQPHRLADLAAFYRASGLEVAEDAGERHDHLCLELEFMCVLAAKEAWALAHGLGSEALDFGRDIQRKFLREHLGRWTPAFARRLASETADPVLRSLAEFTRRFIESECAHFGVPTGSEDLLLRPVDVAAESMCDSCGISQVPPGATGAP